MTHTNKFESLRKVELWLMYSSEEGSKLYNVLPFIKRLFLRSILKIMCSWGKKKFQPVKYIYHHSIDEEIKDKPSIENFKSISKYLEWFVSL